MGRIKQVLVDTGVEDIAIIHEIPESIYREAQIEEATRIIREATDTA